MSAGQLRVSVALATYNGERHLDQQLQSIASQTVHPAEVVLCDDRSTDCTVEVARNFAEHVSFPVRIFTNEHNVGFIRNFRNAVGMCTGDLIALCDQDDWWHPNRLRVCIDHFHDPAVQLLYHNAAVVDASGRKLGLLYDARTEQAAINPARPFPFHSSYGLTQVFRSELRRFDDLWDDSLNHLGDQRDILAHDQWFFFLAQSLGKVAFNDAPLVEYRQHGSNLVGASWVRPTIGRRLFGRIGHRGCHDERRASGGRSRAAILRSIQKREGSSDGHLELLAQAYDLITCRLERRASTYCGARFADRC